MLGLTKPSPTSNTPPPAGSTGTTTAGSTAPSEWSRPPNTSKPTTLPSTRRSSPHENGTKAVTLHGAGAAQYRRPPVQPGQEPGRDRVELANVAEGERPQKRPQRRGGIRRGEHPTHPAVPQQPHVIDRVSTRHHPRDQQGHL